MIRLHTVHVISLRRFDHSPQPGSCPQREMAPAVFRAWTDSRRSTSSAPRRRRGCCSGTTASRP